MHSEQAAVTAIAVTQHQYADTMNLSRDQLIGAMVGGVLGHADVTMHVLAYAIAIAATMVVLRLRRSSFTFQRRACSARSSSSLIARASSIVATNIGLATFVARTFSSAGNAAYCSGVIQCGQAAGLRQQTR